MLSPSSQREDIRRIWSAPENRWLLASVGVIFLTLMMFHNPGWTQRGYNRFSMDLAGAVVNHSGAWPALA